MIIRLINFHLSWIEDSLAICSLEAGEVKQLTFLDLWLSNKTRHWWAQPSLPWLLSYRSLDIRIVYVRFSLHASVGRGGLSPCSCYKQAIYQPEPKSPLSQSTVGEESVGWHQFRVNTVTRWTQKFQACFCAFRVTGRHLIFGQYCDGFVSRFLLRDSSNGRNSFNSSGMTDSTTRTHR